MSRPLRHSEPKALSPDVASPSAAQAAPRPTLPARRSGLRPLRSLDYLCRDLVALRHRRDREIRARVRAHAAEGFLLVHVPKTAGTSVSSAFYGPDVFIGHTTARMLRRAIGPWAYSRLLTFGFVRDPLTRLHSSYRYLRAGGAQNRYDLKWRDALEPFPTLERLVADEQMLGELMRRQLHFRPQHHFLCDPSGRLLVREVGRFEHLADDVERIAGAIGVDVSLPRLNSSSPAAEVPLDRTAVERVRDLYAGDRQLFGYV